MNAGQVAEVAPGVLRVACLIGETKPLYQYVIQGRDTWLWVDAGIATTPADYLLDALPPDQAKRHLLVVTHADVDHFGGIAALRAAMPRLTVCAHRADVRWIVDREAVLAERYLAEQAQGIVTPAWRQAQLRDRGGPAVRVDVELSGGEVFDLEPAGSWTILHAPGHSPGHIVLWEAARRIAVVGDAALGWGVPNIHGALAAPPPYYDVAAYQRTVEMLAGLHPRMLLASHEEVLEGPAVGRFLQASRDAVGAIGRAVDVARGEGVRSLEDLCLRVAALLNRWPADTAPGLATPIAAHLAG